MSLPPLRDQFAFTVVLALREALKAVRLRREISDPQIQIMALRIVEKILQSNWRIRQGPPAVGGGRGERPLAPDEEISK
jgi:hypothetical protein